MTLAPLPAAIDHVAAVCDFRSDRPADLPLSVAELTTLVRAVADDPAVWGSVLTIPAPGADRWWTRLYTSEAVDVWLLAWLPGHTTELHDHGRSAAAFTVVRGELAEDRVRPAGTRTRFTRATGSVTGLARGVRHDVTGSGVGPAVSVHAYSPPLTEMNYFDDAGQLVRTVVSHEPEEELQR